MMLVVDMCVKSSNRYLLYDPLTHSPTVAIKRFCNIDFRCPRLDCVIPI